MNTLTLNEEILTAYGRYLRTNEKSPYTIDKYIRDAEAFRSFASGRPLTKELAVDYKRYLIESGKYADSSINSMLASLRGLFKYLGRDDCNVARLRTQEMPYCPENKSLTMEEYRRLLNAAEGNQRLQMMLKVLAGTGIRVSELKYFTVEAIRKKERRTSIRVSCKRKSREIIIPDGLREELSAYIRKRRIKEGVIFRTRSGRPVDRSNFWRQMKRLCKKAGVGEDKVFPHNIRKLFARMFYESSHDIAQLACLLGHSSVNTTMIYVRRTEREVRARVDRMMREILRKIGERGERDPEKAGKAGGGRKPGQRQNKKSTTLSV